MANQLLEENQAKEFSDVIATYTFTAEGGGAEMAKSPEKNALKAGIKLHFLRYGYFLYTSSEDKTTSLHPPANNASAYGNEVLAANDQMPTLDKFYKARTFLNEGYIYLINDDDPNDFYEYESNGDGTFSTISWEFNKDAQGNYLDIRKSENDNLTFKIITTEKNFWIAYSTVQWGRDYHNEINTDRDKRAQRMVLINCSGIPKSGGSREDHIIHYDEVYACHYEDVNYRAFRQELELIRTVEENEDSAGDNEVYEDMFITLNDPIGCALDVSRILGNAITRQKAMLESIQTGRDIEQVYVDMLSGKTPNQPTEEEQQIGALVHLALTQYKLVYDNDEMIDDYDGGSIGNPVSWNFHMMGGGPRWQGTGIYKPKLLNILGVDERKAQRAIIRLLQNDLGAILESNYYQDAYIHAENGTDLNCIDGKFFAMQPLKLLAIKPHLQDKMFDLISHEEIDTTWDPLILEYLNENADSPVYNVLNRRVDIGEDTIKQGIDLSNKLAAFVTASLETYAKYAVEDIVVTTWVETTTNRTVSGNYELTLKRLNTINVYGEDMFEVRGYEVQEKMQSAGWRIDEGKIVAGTYRGKKDLLRWVRSKSPELILKETSHGRHIFDIPVTKEVEEIIRTPEFNKHKTPTKLGTKATRVLEGTPFKGVVALLQVFNIGAAYHTFKSDRSNKNRTNLFGITAELTSATSYLAKSTLTNVIGKSAMSGIGKLAFSANVVGSGVTAIMCTWEAVLSFDARDINAGFAWGGAAAAFAGVTAMIFVSASWAGPVGWACAGIGVGLVFLAYYFTDSPIEKFFKNNVLSDEVDWKILPEETPGAYNKRFYLNRNTINPDGDFKMYNDFKFAGATLTDFIVCSNIDVRIKSLINEQNSNTGLCEAVLGSHESVKEGDVKTFQFMISFRQFLRTADQLAHSIYFYENGISNGSHEKVEVASLGSVIDGDDNNTPHIDVEVTIPTSVTTKYKLKSQILIVCALSLGNDKFYPAMLNEDHRYLGAYIDVHHIHTTTTTRVGQSTNIEFNKSNIAIAPLEQLLSGKAWEN